MDMFERLLWPLSFLEIAAGTIAILLCSYCISLAVYRLFFSPLRKIPGPWYAAVSEFWITTHILRLRRCRAIDELFQKYGPIVRIAPNKVIFNDVATTKAVYGVSAKLAKSEFYSSLKTNGNDQAMSVLSHAEHGVRKRGYAPHYVQANLSLFQSDFQGIVHRMIEILSFAGKHRNVDVDTLTLFRHMMIDVNCVHMFNYESEALLAWSKCIFDGSPPDRLSMAISDYPKRGTLIDILPRTLWAALQFIPVTRWQYFCQSSVYVGKFVEGRLVEKKYFDNQDRKFERRSLIDRLVSHSYSEQQPMPDKDVISECVGHLIAGSDTTAITLSYICWELSRRPDVMLRLQAELDAAMPNAQDIPELSVLQDLPFLTAVIKEGLRIYTAGPSPLERVAPGEDGKSSPLKLLDYDIPPGTIIASQAWSIHRAPDVFFSPEQFLPERWLLDTFLDTRPVDSTRSSPKDGDAPSKLSVGRNGREWTKLYQHELSANLFPFGHGPRVCGGQNIAQMLLRICLAAVVRNFDLVPAKGTDEKSMEIKDSFVIFPAALECRLVFIPRAGTR